MIAAGVIAQLLVEHGRALRTIGADDDDDASRCSWRSPCCCRAAATAHEYWLLPDRFAAPAAEPIAIAHRVGTGWPGETLPRDPARIVRFALVDAARRAADRRRARRRSGGHDRPAPTRHRPRRLPLAAVAGAARGRGVRELPARGRAGRASSPPAPRAASRSSPGIEIFSRNAKAMLVAPGAAAARDAQRWRRPVGLTLELVPETDPRRLARRRHVRAAPAPSRQAARGRAGQGLSEGRQRAGRRRRAPMREGRVRLVLPEARHLADQRGAHDRRAGRRAARAGRACGRR